MVSAVLLGAGYGTRLYPLTQDRPKALLGLGGQGRVVLDWIWSAVQTVPDLSTAVLVSNHRFAGQFEDWRRKRGASLEVLDDGTSTPKTRLGAIRDLLLALARIAPQEDVVVLGTDNLFTWSLAEFAAFGRRWRPAVTIAVDKVDSLERAKQCGVVEQDPQGRLIRCVEKPAAPNSLTVSLCVYYIPDSCRVRLEEFVQGGGNADAPGYFLEWLVPREPVYGFMAAGKWFDIGSVEAYQYVSAHWSEFVPLTTGAGHA